jgi:hypothetical protein
MCLEQELLSLSVSILFSIQFIFFQKWSVFPTNVVCCSITQNFWICIRYVGLKWSPRIWVVPWPKVKDEHHKDMCLQWVFTIICSKCRTSFAKLNIVFSIIFYVTKVNFLVTWSMDKFTKIFIPTYFQLIQMLIVETKFDIYLHPNNYVV